MSTVLNFPRKIAFSAQDFDPTVLFKRGLGLLQDKRGTQQDRVERLRQSVKYFEQALEAQYKPRTEAYNNIAQAYRALGDTTQMELYLRKVLDIDPDNIMALYNFGEFVMASRPAEAYTYFITALSVSGVQEHDMYGSLCYNHAVVLIQQGQPSDALMFLQTALTFFRKKNDTNSVRDCTTVITRLKQQGKVPTLIERRA